MSRHHHRSSDQLSSRTTERVQAVLQGHPPSAITAVGPTPVLPQLEINNNSWLQRLSTAFSAKFQHWQPGAYRWSMATQDKHHRIQGAFQRSLPGKALRKVKAIPFIGATLLLVGLVGIISLVYLMRDLPSPRRLTSKENFAVSTQIFDRHGVLLYEIFGDENRIPIKIADLPPYVKQAAISIEDKNFYHHFGFDIVGITRATYSTLSGKRVEGGSTITQQLVKNALLTTEKTFTRKAKEGILSVMTEVLYTKEEILEMYLNYISYGGTSVGIEAAAKSYFGKSAKDLTLGEAALLAGLPQAPSTYSPFGSNPEKAKARQAEVLRRMTEDGYITQAQADAAKAETLHYALSKTDIQAPHFVFYVRDLLYQKYGVDTVERGGLRVTTTLDLDLQKQAQASLSAEVAKSARLKVGNGAAMVTRPDTGEILAMIGSTDYFDTAHDGQVNVTLAHRQPGSSIKPIMYATAFENKILNPGTMLLDVPTCFKVAGQKDYCPKNYSGDFKGAISVRKSLGNSLNIPAVKGLYAIGLTNFIDEASKLGITTWTDPSKYGLSLTLGGGEVKMIDMAQAFGTIANQGVKVPLTPILKIEDYKGQVLEDTNPAQRQKDLADLTENEDEESLNELTRVMHRAPAYLVSHIMQDNTARVLAFGPNSELVFKGQIVSAKTGTTNDMRDNWTVGFTPKLLTIAWVGNNDGSYMSNLASGITGAAPIFHDIMSLVLRDQEPVWPVKPDDVALGQICSSGMPPQAGIAPKPSSKPGTTTQSQSSSTTCTSAGTELYWKESLPSASSVTKTNVWVHPDTNLPLAAGESTDGLVLQEHTIYSDPVTQNYCADCARPVSDQGKIIYEQRTIDIQAGSDGEAQPE